MRTVILLCVYQLGEMHMRLPEIAARLVELSKELKCPELKKLAGEIGRRSSAGRAPASSQSMTPAIAKKIKQIKAAHPDYPYTRIASMLNINPGRVSETLKGKRQ